MILKFFENVVYRLHMIYVTLRRSNVTVYPYHIPCGDRSHVSNQDSALHSIPDQSNISSSNFPKSLIIHYPPTATTPYWAVISFKAVQGEQLCAVHVTPARFSYLPLSRYKPCHLCASDNAGRLSKGCSNNLFIVTLAGFAIIFRLLLFLSSWIWAFRYVWWYRRVFIVFVRKR